MDEEKLCHIGFSHFLGIGPHFFKSLVSVFRTAEKAYNASPDKLEPVLGKSLTRRFAEFRVRTDLQRLYRQIVDKHITIISLNEVDYPSALGAIPDPPICLYVKGESMLLRERLFSVVGTRNPTAYGIQIARHLSSLLAEHGFVIVSGMALGIDAVAHGGALDAGGKTIAVLGCGVDIVYPPSHRLLYGRILAEGGAVISEFPPGHTVRKGLFVVRNRIISGLSLGLLVVEGTDKSGTLTTAKYAADQGKPVFAPPAPITSYVSQAPNLLLKQGAVLVTGIEDILHEFGLQKRKRISFDLTRLTEEEKQIVYLLQKENNSIDEMVIKLQLPLPVISTIISRLEILNLIEKDEAGSYCLHLA